MALIFISTVIVAIDKCQEEDVVWGTVASACAVNLHGAVYSSDMSEGDGAVTEWAVLWAPYGEWGAVHAAPAAPAAHAAGAHQALHSLSQQVCGPVAGQLLTSSLNPKVKS